MSGKAKATGYFITNWAAKGIIIAAAAVFVALLWLNITNFAFYDDNPGDLLYFFAAPAIAAIAVLSMLCLPADWRIVAAWCFVAIVPALYGAELYLTLAFDDRPQEVAAARGDELDWRSKLEVILQLRREGRDAYPTVRAKDLLVDGPGDRLVSPIISNGEQLLPLATVPDKTVVSCNETGQWLVYRSDRHGFHNPAHSWETPPQIMLIGDSFVHGDCVPSDTNLAALLRRRYGAVINLGVPGSGPLSELAALKEYVSTKTPPIVLWFFFEGNDLTKDLPREKRSEILMSYLRPGFDQGLASRGEEMALSLATYLDRHMEEALGRVDHPQEALLDFLQLYHLRERFGLDAIGLGVEGKADEANFELYGAILEEAKRTVASWGGRLYYVYLPDSTRYFSWHRHLHIRDLIRTRVLEIVARLGLPTIDIHPEFAAHDPNDLFHYPGSHYNEAGYRLVAETIAKEIERAAAVSSRRP